jgi:hypothetical protein
MIAQTGVAQTADCAGNSFNRVFEWRLYVTRAGQTGSSIRFQELAGEFLLCSFEGR